MLVPILMELMVLRSVTDHDFIEFRSRNKEYQDVGLVQLFLVIFSLWRLDSAVFCVF